MIRRRHPAILAIAVLAGCQQLLGLDPGNPSSGTGGSAGSPGSTTTGGQGGKGSTSSSSGGGTGGATSTSTSPSSTSSTTSGITGVCAGNGTRVLTNTQPDRFIEDFEESTGIAVGWSAFNDVMPTPNSFQLVQVTPGAAGTMHSGHYAGTGAITTNMGGYGVGLVYNIAIDPALGLYCVDISAFTGVSFWAKTAMAGSSISVNFVLPATNMASMNDAGMMTGGNCTSDCYNHPHINFTLTDGWVQYTAPFAMASGGTATVESVIQELAWLSPDSDWDFTLDEIAFYSGTPPAGAVGPNPNGN